MKSTNHKMRFERKYLMDRDAALLLRQRISYALKPDSSGPAGQYKVSSVYFDGRHNTAFFEKQNGFLNREKLRMRYYNGDTDSVRLERKIKNGEMVSKEREPLGKEQYGMMLKGDYGFMRNEVLSPLGNYDFMGDMVPPPAQKTPLFERFYALHLLRGMRPVVVVDYDRLAFIHAPGNVRITFDSNLAARVPHATRSHIVLPAENVILEVKYDHFLPSFIASLLSGFQLTQQLALSKFAMSRLALQGM